MHFGATSMHFAYTRPLPSRIAPYTLVKRGRAMKIEIETNESLREPEVIVRCAVVDDPTSEAGCSPAWTTTRRS